MNSARLGAAAVALVLLLLCQSQALSQDYFTVYRGDEVGPRVIDLDEEGFMNILSFGFPLEMENRWLLSDGGYRVTFGSLDQRQFFLEQDLRIRADLGEDLKVMTYARQAVDLDTDYIFIQPTVEWEVHDGFELLIPTSVAFDKGTIDLGVGARWRAPELGVQYLQLSWIRADFLFDTHSLDSETSREEKPADSFEFQGMSRIGPLGESIAKVSLQLPSSYLDEEAVVREKFRRFSARWLHRADVGRLSTLFLELQVDSAAESRETGEPDTDPDEFEGQRDYYRARVEYQWDLEPDTADRIKAGLQFHYLTEEEDLPNDRKRTRDVLQRETVLYGGYRYAFSPTFSLETVLFLAYRSVRNRYPYNDVKEGREEDPFQGKLNFYLRWDVSDRAYFVLTPSFEVDDVDWGGGGFQLVYYF